MPLFVNDALPPAPPVPLLEVEHYDKYNMINRSVLSFYSFDDAEQWLRGKLEQITRWRDSYEQLETLNHAS